MVGEGMNSALRFASLVEGEGQETRLNRVQSDK